ncbi:hypothetical protein CAI21_07865 [Alkalilimnicola ehrlichii]|uniref:DUF5050 domain-containing protein n=1 Tax=Alkalilimnicola ehrlichii TaxID=351052 RepID=A0A3E0WWS6_9GAMM|nr:PD40 domain-containing protein [Alkalilimnicola ehrlichii]RFA30108.1 hypothetical protein CAI21_07865 [Alkalilimnicola ehrlichii]RFA37454.1 hypothetical protein CAL65_09210 [Alkalilimnicola ehrlichii]
MRLVSLSVALSIVFLSAAAHAATWPAGAAFLGYAEERWSLWIVRPGEQKPTLISDVSEEPTDFAYSQAQAEVVYLDIQGRLWRLSLDSGTSQLLLESQDDAFAQPAYSEQDNRIFLVRLKGGASEETSIVALNSHGNPGFAPVISQRSSQFDPAHQGDLLYYAQVACVKDCGRIIQDIWRRNLASGRSEQVTRVNAIAKEPTPSPDGRWIYFSSNKAGQYHLWRVSADGAEYQQLTEGNVADTNPAVDKEGNVYFIRRSPLGTEVRRWSPNGIDQQIALPPGVSDIRSLKVAR